MNSLVAIIMLAVVGLACCDAPRHFNSSSVELVGASRRFNSSFVEMVGDIVDGSRRAVGDDVLVKGEKVKDAMEEFLEENDDYFDGDDDNTTEVLGVDSRGCDRGARKVLEEKCDAEYDKVNEEAQKIEDEKEKLEAVCCALEDFEKCSLGAYDKANCATDKAAIRENLRAARLFLSVVANISCNEFRGQCAHYPSDATSDASSSSSFTELFIVSAAVILSVLV